MIVEVLRAGEGLVADLGEAALDAEGDAGSIQEDGRFIAFARESDRLEDVHEANGALERDGVESDESLLAGFGFDILEDLFLVVYEEIAFLVCGRCYGCHVGPPCLGGGMGGANGVPD